jgi:hypothetical protein
MPFYSELLRSVEHLTGRGTLRLPRPVRVGHFRFFETKILQPVHGILIANFKVAALP